MNNSPASQSKSLLQRLVQCHGYLLQSGAEWCLFSRRNRYARPVDRVAAALVRILHDQGHLRERPAGGLEPLQSAMGRSHRLTDHRPSRPQEEGHAKLVINDAESPLAWLRSRKDKAGRALISVEQFMAGERLRADYERSCLERRVTASWDLPQTSGRNGSGVADLSDAALTARGAMQDALDETGPELASILVQVCCLSAGIEQAERILDLPQRSGKAVLGLALTALARHYGYLRGEPRNRGRTNLSHWGLGDYRPLLPAVEET